MKINDEREPLAKLQEHEFYLDLEELERLHKESDAEIARVIWNFIISLSSKHFLTIYI